MTELAEGYDVEEAMPFLLLHSPRKARCSNPQKPRPSLQKKGEKIGRSLSFSQQHVALLAIEMRFKNAHPGVHSRDIWLRV